MFQRQKVIVFPEINKKSWVAHRIDMYEEFFILADDTDESFYIYIC